MINSFTLFPSWNICLFNLKVQIESAHVDSIHRSFALMFSCTNLALQKVVADFDLRRSRLNLLLTE